MRPPRFYCAGSVLVAANPSAHRELGRFQALHAKTWNHPVIAHGRLFVRNAQEIACHEVAGKGESGRDP
jgi:hypothetical protein